MDLCEAVSLAKAGDGKGFEYLYGSTYKSKYYLALQYMKNEESAKDVLQEAYMKAFTNLEKLEKPEAFAGWLGTIVANTAKNMLGKKNPMLFSDVAVNEEEEHFEYQIEDENVENQPEIAYTRKETQELVHELMESLSEEQRICLLMFHIEGASISEIAAALNCSENTVKSRLNYGRKNLKARAEELQKKGYKLYSVSPLPLLLLLLRSEGAMMSADTALIMLGKEIWRNIRAQFPGWASAAAGGAGAAAGGAGAGAGAKGAAAGSRGAAGAKAAGAGAKAAGAGAKAAAGKIAAIIVGTCVIGGGAFYAGAKLTNQGTKPVVQEEVKPQPDTQAEQEEKKPEVPEEQEVKDEEYSSLIAGNLTKEELEFVLTNGPEEIPEQGFREYDYLMAMQGIAVASEYVERDRHNLDPLIKETYGSAEKFAANGIDYQGTIPYNTRTGKGGESQFSLSDINRFFSSFTDFQFTEENEDPVKYEINGDQISFMTLDFAYVRKAEITSATYTDTEMKVYFTFESNSYEWGKKTLQKCAILKPDEEGKYRIVKIKEASKEEETKKDNTGADAGTTAGTERDKIMAMVAFKKKLKSIQNKEPGYEFPEGGTGKYEYFLTDMDGDGIPEMVVGAEVPIGQAFLGHNIRIYTFRKDGERDLLGSMDGDEPYLWLSIPKDGKGLFAEEYSRGTGDTWVYRITIEYWHLVRGSKAEYEFRKGTDKEKQFEKSVSEPQWRDISDLSGLDM